MSALSLRLRRRIEAEERRRVLEEIQLREAREQPFLSPPALVTRRLRPWLELVGEILVAMIVSVVGMIINFFVFVKLLHFQP